MKPKLVILSLACSLAAACGKSDKADQAGSAAPGGGGGGGGAPAGKIDVAAVNALIPASLEGKLVFEQRDLVETRGDDTVTYTLAAPKDWTQSSKMFAKVRATDELGFMTSFGVGSNCDGECVAKDWAKVADKVELAQFKGAKVIKDEATKTSRLVIAEQGGSTHVVYAWWTDGGDHYFSCRASLEAAAAAAAPAFAKACQAVTVRGR